MVLKFLQKVLLFISVFIILINVIFIFQKAFFKESLPKIFGFSQAVVSSNSMSPNIKKGDFLIFKESDVYKVDDIIIFSEEDYFVTHRIVSESEEGFVTKGDNNNTNDKQILNQNNIEGLLVFNIPKLGYIINFATSITGITFFVVLIISIYILHKYNIKTAKLQVLSIAVLFVLLIQYINADARYISGSLGSDEAKVATVVMNSNLENNLNITLTDIEPGDIRYYDFSVVNYNGDIISEVKQDYTITVKTTNNLPLAFELVLVEDKGFKYASDFVFGNPNYIASNGVLGNEIKEDHDYQLKISYDISKANINYINEIDVVTLVIDSVQKID